jgi:hypothetical protein
MNRCGSILLLELDRGQVVQGHMRAHPVVMLPPTFDHDLRFASSPEPLQARHSSRNLPLNDSLVPFCQGLPGSISAVSMWLSVDRSAEPSSAAWGVCRTQLGRGRSRLPMNRLSVRIGRVDRCGEARTRLGNRESSARRCARAIQIATASRVGSVTSNCTGRCVGVSLDRKRAACYQSLDWNSARSRAQFETCSRTLMAHISLSFSGVF